MILLKFCGTYIVKQTQKNCFTFGGIVETTEELCGMYEAIPMPTSLFHNPFAL